VSIVAEAGDDEALLAALRQAVDAMRDVPPDFVEAGKQAFAWHNVDAELAQLTYDSASDPAAETSVRSETASVRALTFTSAHLAIELEVTADSVAGQVTPAQSATITVQPRTGDETDLSTDETGCFSVHPTPPVMFRLHVRAGADVDVLTRWITLS
jgi:prophage DNA circulation protein